MLTIFLFGTLLGVLSNDVLSKYIITGEKGIQYYAQAHLSDLNIYVHILCMPFTIYGILFCISSFFYLNEIYSKKISYLLYFIYGGHYFKINIYGAISFYIMYYPVIYYFNYYYKYDLIILDTLKKKNIIFFPSVFYLFKKGFIISFISLLTQEIIGHYMGGDIDTRPNGVLNTILYAMYFSSSKLFDIQ